LKRQSPNWGSRRGLTDLLALRFLQPSAEWLRRVARVQHYRPRPSPDLDVRVVELSGELDIVSADFMTNVLTEVAGSVTRTG
jgi:hypothetical protein